MPRLEPIGDDIWIAEGPDVRFLGFPYPTRMGIVRLDDGRLWVWSPIALDAELQAEVEALGEPRHATEPNKLHHLALGQWVEAWPALRLHPPPGLARKRADLEFAEELTDDAPPEWAGQIDQVVVRGSVALTEVLFHHRRSRTCFVGDLIQKHEPGALKAWQRWIMKADGLTGPQGSTPREWRLTFLDRDAARRAIETAVAWAPRQLVIAHGTWTREDGARVLRSSMRWLGLPET